MQIVIILGLAALWLGAMWLGFVFVFPVVFPLTLVAATGGVLGYYYLHACRTLVPATVDGPSRVEVPPPARFFEQGLPGSTRSSVRDPAYRHYLLTQVWLDWWTI